MTYKQLNIKTLTVVLLLTVLLTAGGTLAFLKLPWRTVLPGTMVAAVMTYRAIDRPVEALAGAQVAGVIPPQVTDTSVTLPLAVAAAPAPRPTAPQPAEPVDYSRLNDDVLLVANTLDNFNQKLLRLIAHARAMKKQQQDAAEADAVAIEASPAELLPKPGTVSEPELQQ